MASAGQGIGAAVGLVVGYYFGFGMGGMALGGMIGLWLDPPDPPDPPPLGDLGNNSYVRNMPVTLAYGRNKIYGGIIWIGNNRVEMSNEGSSKQPNYVAVYSADFGCALCEGSIGGIVNYYINDNILGELKDEDKISLTFYPEYGNGSQTINSIVEANLSGSTAPAIPWRWTAVVIASGKIGKSNSLPSFAAEVNALLCEADYESNPVKVVYDFMTNDRYGLNLDASLFDGSPTTSGSWKIAADYCEVAVDDTLGGTEARFRYSMAFTNRVKAFDIIKDILQTCRGFIYYLEGKLKIQIADANEVPLFYFSEGHQVNFITGGSCTTTRIYADFSEYPVGYFNGDLLSIQLSAYYCEISVVIDQTATYIDLDEALTDSPASSVFFSIRKENIIRDTFSYARKSTSDKPNRHRVEFINKSDKYRTDFIEEDNLYDINLTDEIRETTVQCNGIKRKSQAARMNSFFLDFNSYTDYTCSFQTDIVGYMLGIGSIIGITNYLPGWSSKLFRVIELEELEDYTVKVSCLEYIATVFHDNASPIIPTDDYSIPNPYTEPANSTRFEVFEDSTSKKLFLCFNRPDNEPNWAGNLVYVNKGSAYEYASTGYVTTPSVKLNGDLNASDTTIPYDAATMVGSFPASGSFWVGVEEILYTSIDDINDEFEGCTRGYNRSSAISHLSSEYCNLRQSNTPYYVYTDEEIGGLFTFKIISINVYDIQADPLTALTDTIVIVGVYYAPDPVSGLQINSQGSDYSLADSTDCLIQWDLTSDGIQGYGVQYADGLGYGGGSVEYVVGFEIRIYKTSDDSLLHTEVIGDITTQEFNYTVAMNEADNGSVFEPNLTIKVYEKNTVNIYSITSILVTND